MKKDIHPKTYTTTKVTCSCGHTFDTQSILESIQVEVCSKCHPFYTGVEKFVDTEGRVDKFFKKQQVAKDKQKIIKQAKKEKKATPAHIPTFSSSTTGGMSLKDLIKKQTKK